MLDGGRFPRNGHRHEKSIDTSVSTLSRAATRESFLGDLKCRRLREPGSGCEPTHRTTARQSLDSTRLAILKTADITPEVKQKMMGEASILRWEDWEPANFGRIWRCTSSQAWAFQYLFSFIRQLGRVPCAVARLAAGRRLSTSPSHPRRDFSRPHPIGTHYTRHRFLNGHESSPGTMHRATFAHDLSRTHGPLPASPEH